jgi:hypothetical protein
LVVGDDGRGGIVCVEYHPFCRPVRTPQQPDQIITKTAAFTGRDMNVFSTAFPRRFRRPRSRRYGPAPRPGPGGQTAAPRGRPKKVLDTLSDRAFTGTLPSPGRRSKKSTARDRIGDRFLGSQNQSRARPPAQAPTTARRGPLRAGRMTLFLIPFVPSFYVGAAGTHDDAPGVRRSFLPNVEDQAAGSCSRTGRPTCFSNVFRSLPTTILSDSTLPSFAGRTQVLVSSGIGGAVHDHDACGDFP